MFRKRAYERAMRDKVQHISRITKIATSPGNWDYSPYLHGMANGLILAESILTNAERPNYLDAPEKWGCEKEEHSIIGETHASGNDNSKSS